jgi:universal stress protein E
VRPDTAEEVDMHSLNIRSILVASDLQPSSDAAVAGAAALADRLGAELHILHALELPNLGYPMRDTAVDYQELAQGARRSLQDQLSRSLPAGSTVQSQCVRVERPQRAINDRASEVAADLIVLGPHRPRAFRGPILGNTADRVLRSAKVPILILAEPLSLPLRNVTVPIDLSDPARGALDQGLVWASVLGSADGAGPAARVRVRVLHVIPRAYEAYDFPFDRTVILPELHREIEGARARLGGVENLDVQEEIIWGNAPADEIIRYVEKGVTDVLVMGTHGYGALGRALIGSIASMVARAAPCPVLLVPPPLWAESDAEIPIEAEWSEPTVSSA